MAYTSVPLVLSLRERPSLPDDNYHDLHRDRASEQREDISRVEFLKDLLKIEGGIPYLTRVLPEGGLITGPAWPKVLAG